MRAAAHRIVRQRKIIHEAVRKRCAKRPRRAVPLAPLRRLVPGKLRHQRQRPGPAIGPLEPAGGGAREIRDLPLDLGGGQAVVEQGADLLRRLQLGEQAKEAGEQPVGVH